MCVAPGPESQLTKRAKLSSGLTGGLRTIVSEVSVQCSNLVQPQSTQATDSFRAGSQAELILTAHYKASHLPLPLLISSPSAWSAPGLIVQTRLYFLKALLDWSTIRSSILIRY
jgi:uncharacterized membrane protein